MIKKRLAEMQTQALYNALDARNVVVLRDDERAQRLKRLLLQNADAAREFGGFFQRGVQSGKHFAGLFVICVKIEIIKPNVTKFLLGAV